MANIFIISDTHFGHKGILTFQLHEEECPNFMVKRTPESPKCDCQYMRNIDGKPFTSVEEMDDYMVTRWNAVVKPPDKVYHLGDVAMGKQNIATVGRCNGHKRKVGGNHDDEPHKYYAPFFEDFYGSRKLDDLLLTHIPIHPQSLPVRLTNVHGHVHNNVGPLHFGPNYFNVSVEVIDYTPISLDECRKRIREQKAENQRLVSANLKRLGVTPWDEGLEGL